MHLGRLGRFPLDLSKSGLGLTLESRPRPAVFCESFCRAFFREGGVLGTGLASMGHRDASGGSGEFALDS